MERVGLHFKDYCNSFYLRIFSKDDLKTEFFNKSSFIR